MAYTQDQINAAYAAERANGASDADLQAIGASKYGVTGEQFNLASAAYAPTSAPTAIAPPADRFTDDQYAAARQWASGKDGATILNKGADLGLTSAEMGKVFGEFGGSGSQVTGTTGYGSGYTGFTADGQNKPNAMWGGWDKEAAKWKFDTNTGWSQDQKKLVQPPTTGISLSDLQGPTRWDVAPNETVRSQLQQIIADDSPLMQQARARALQTANGRGLLNSTMAMTAADSAMYDAAMPIATQDASTYARSGEFNANTKNTFSRDNNQFVRDAYMADFNVQANDWAAQQQFEREYKMLDRQQQLTLERDAVQNGYQSARDKYMNEFQATRDSTANQWNVSAADKEAALRLKLAQMDAAARASSVQPDTSLERLRMQLEADASRTDRQEQSDTISNLNALRSEYADKVFRINTSELSPEKADKAVLDLAATYNPMITSAAAKLGYDPASWVIKIEKPEATTTAATSGASGGGYDGGDGP